MRKPYWYDPATGQVGGMWKPFSNYQITHMATAEEGRILVISTRRVEDSVLGKPKPEQGTLWLFDTLRGELVDKFEPVPKAKGTGPIVGVGGQPGAGLDRGP